MLQKFEEIALPEPLLVEDAKYESAMTRWSYIEYKYGCRVRGEFILLSGDHIGGKLIKHWSSVEQDQDGFIIASPRTCLHKDYTRLFGYPRTGKIDMNHFIGLPVVISTRCVMRNVDHRTRGRDKRYSVVDRVMNLVCLYNTPLSAEANG